MALRVIKETRVLRVMKEIRDHKDLMVFMLGKALKDYKVQQHII